MKKEIRWHYRFKNFSRALDLLQTPLETGAPLNDLELSGIIRRFQYTFELAWKLLKDRMEYAGIKIPAVAPRTVIKEAFAAKFIANGDAWLDMLEARNNTSHNYDSEKFEKIMDNICHNYIGLLHDLHAKLNAELNES
ncbi:MAG: nucleotidyltransferase [Betaproteobacteria bacterium]|nr:nucleotidyltransferase [Betaproteobacteria bacterium]